MIRRFRVILRHRPHVAIVNGKNIAPDNRTDSYLIVRSATFKSENPECASIFNTYQEAQEGIDDRKYKHAMADMFTKMFFVDIQVSDDGSEWMDVRSIMDIHNLENMQ